MASQPKLAIQIRGEPSRLARAAAPGGTSAREERLARLRGEPGRLLFHQGGQSSLDPLQGLEGAFQVEIQGIGLQHAHIPSTESLLEGGIPHGQPEKGWADGCGKHKPAVGKLPVQGRENGGTARGMAEAVTADAGVDQHGNQASGWAQSNCS